MTELLKKSLKLFSVLAFVSCTVSAPIIRESDWNIIIVNDIEKETIYETLSVFLNCYDDDGENDIETVFLIDDESGFYWELNSDNWDVKTADDVRWIGSKSLMMPDRSAIPRSPIRIHVRDLAGEHVEDKLYISKRNLDLETLNFPKLKIENDMFFLSAYEKGFISIYSDEELIKKSEISGDPQSFKDLFGKNRSSYNDDIKFYVTVLDVDLILKSGPWY